MQVPKTLIKVRKNHILHDHFHKWLWLVVTAIPKMLNYNKNDWGSIKYIWTLFSVQQTHCSKYIYQYLWVFQHVFFHVLICVMSSWFVIWVSFFKEKLLLESWQNKFYMIPVRFTDLLILIYCYEVVCMLIYLNNHWRVFHLASNCKAEFQGSESWRRHVENQIGSKRALEGVQAEAPINCSAFIGSLAITWVIQKSFQKQQSNLIFALKAYKCQGLF